MKKPITAVILSTTLLLASCGGSIPDKSSSSRSAQKTIAAPPVSLPPESCLLVATIIAVDPVTAGDSGPCGQVPCTATVRVDSVLGYGSAYPRPLAPGETIKAFFSYTLAPTHELFPSKLSFSPPLEKGSTFKGVTGARRAGLDGEVSGIEVNDYEKR